VSELVGFEPCRAALQIDAYYIDDCQLLVVADHLFIYHSVSQSSFIVVKVAVAARVDCAC